MKVEELLPDSYRKTIDLATQFVLEHPDFIKSFIFDLDKQKPEFAMRMSRVLSFCHESRPELVIPFKDELLNVLSTTKHNSVKRNMLYIFQTAWNKLDEDDLGKLLDISFKHMENPVAEPALRMYSMNIIFATTSVYPELKNELRNIIEFHYEEGSAGFKAGSRKILKNLNK